MFRRPLLIISLVVAFLPLSAQSIEDLKIPTLDSLLAVAYANSPMVGYHTQRREEATLLLKANKLSWTQYVGVEAYYRYGRLGVTDQSSISTGLPAPVVTSSQIQNWWYLGAFVRLPISGVVLSPIETKRLRHVEKQSEHEIDDAQMELGQKVVEQYYALLLNIETIKQKAILLETNNAQIQEAENLYKDRKIDLGRMSQLQEMQNKVAIEFATARSNGRIALKKLELLTGLTLTNK